MKSTFSHKGALAAMMLLACVLWAAPVSAQDNEPNPEDPITVDFVQKDIHTVMHYIALRSGLQIIVEGEVSVRLTVMFRNVNPKEAIRSICKANKLDMVEDGQVIIIKQRQQTTQLANVVGSDTEGRFNVSFESHELVQAIMEVAQVTRTEASIPSVTIAEGEQRDPDDEEEGESRARRVQERLVSMYMRNAGPDAIFERLRALGDLKLEVVDRDGAPSYQFTYPPVRRSGLGGEEGPIGGDEGDITILSRTWVVPGGEMSQLKTEVQNLLSPVGRVVSDDLTDFLVVYDVERNLDRVSVFMDPVSERIALVAAEAEAEENPDFVVREYRVMRDIGEEGTQIVGQLADVLSDNGRIIPNPDRNSLVVYERKDNIANIDEIMMMLDTAPEQVLITAKLVEVTLDDYIGYGLELFTSHSADNLNDGRFTGSSQDTGQGNVGGLFGQPTGFDPFFATFTNPRVDVRLELLANEGRVETLSQPTQMVSNKQQARIEVGQEIPYLESSGATGGTTTASVSFKEVSIVMEVTPTVLEGGLIRLDVTVTVRELIGNIAIEGNNTPILSLRESQTNVFIHDGETLVMGGLMRERERMEENGLPFLKDIPFLGYLFKSANRSTSKTDLLFFLRPQIVTAGMRASNSESGLEIERDLRPLLYEDDDRKEAGIREGRYRTLGTAAKPPYYNEKTRPKKPADVKPGA